MAVEWTVHQRREFMRLAGIYGLGFNEVRDLYLEKVIELYQATNLAADENLTFLHATALQGLADKCAVVAKDKQFGQRQAGMVR